MADPYTDITGQITAALNAVYGQAENPDTPTEHKEFLKMCWHRLDAALWCVRQINGGEGPDTRGLPGQKFGAFYGAHPAQAGTPGE